MNIKTMVATVAFFAGIAQAAQTIDFEDVAFAGGNPLAAQAITGAYRGFNWSGEQGSDSWYVSPNDATGWFGGTKQPYARSGDNFSWANGASALEIAPAGGGTFDLVSFWARLWPSTSTSITARGYLNGAQTFEKTVVLDNTYSLVSLNFTQIDRFAIDHQSTNALIDDISISSVAAVPEPETYVLLAVGLGLVGAAARRRKK